MAFLKVLQGSCPGQILELRGPRTVLGRHPNCEVVLDNAAVSRQHAQILESHGSYYLEDLRSRNRTYLNGRLIEGRTELHETDRIKVCDMVFGFHLQMPSGEMADESPTPMDAEAGGLLARPTPPPVLDEEFEPDAEEPEAESETEDMSSIISTLDVRSTADLRLNVKPEAKLRAVLGIGKALANLLALDDVLQTILDRLFDIFPQADAGFVLLKDPRRQKLTVRATKSRGPHDDAAVQVSLTIVRKAMDGGEAILSADAAEDRQFDKSESLSSLRIRSMMCVPLVGKSGDILGVIQLDTKNLPRQFTQDDLDLLASVAAQASLAVEYASLHEELVRQRDAERDLEFATQVQLGFLPSQPPHIEGYEFHDYYEAALRVGGDYFDYVELPDGRIAVAVGDVAGKGVPAALLMARLYSAARYHLLSRTSPADALAGLNAEIVSSGLGHRFITCAVAFLDPRQHRVSIVNAGHLPPFLRDAEGRVRSLGQEESGMPLGVVADQTFQEVVVPLKPGDALLLYTDGVTEAMNSAQEIYGRGRLGEYLSQGPAEVEALVAGVVAEVERFGETRPQRDDMCLVGLRRLPG